MRKHVVLQLVVIFGYTSLGCQTRNGESVSDLGPAFTIREIMQSMVQPRADTLWNAVSTSVTEKGVETNEPRSDEDWAKVRYEAVTLAEAMNSILMPGRKVAKPGEEAKDPSVELSPEEIEMLINQDKEGWSKLAHAMQASVMVAIRAIDEKNADALSQAGGDMDIACETCHKKYWYPNDPGQK